MKLCILIVLAFACLANGYMTHFNYDEYKFDGKDIAYKQKFVLEILRHIHHPLQVTEYLAFGKTFVEGEIYYTDYEKFLDFYKCYQTKFLRRGEVFSIYNKRHLYEVKCLFKLFYYSKDFTTFKKNVIWARLHLNEGMFYYALTAAIIHRDDMLGVMLPSPYEVMPFKFFSSEMITEGINYKMFGGKNMYVDNTMYGKGDMTHYIYQNKTTMDTMDYDYYYNHYMMNKDYKLSYFTEDIGLNTYYFFFQMDYGFWLDFKDTKMDKIYRGEKYLYIHQQLLARYYMERLSNDMGMIYEFDWNTPIETGYFSNLRYYNGMAFPMRPNNYFIRTHTKRDVYITKVYDYERRLRDVIERGFLMLDDGTKIDFRDPKQIDLLGKLIVGYKDYNMYDTTFYRYVELFGRILLSGGVYSNDYHRIIPGVMEHFETSMRDPVFYQLYKRIVKFYFMFKNNLKSYTKDQLYFKGIRFDDVKIDKLITYFDFYDSDITNMMGYKYMDKFDHYDTMNTKENGFDMKKYNFWSDFIKVRTLRLNHMPFTFNFGITSDKDVKVVIRAFIGPKYDEFGHLLTFDQNRENFVEIDKFWYDLKMGKNMITRMSKDFFYSIPDATTYYDLYKGVMTSGDDFKFGMKYKDFYCGFPDRLILPKGKVNGMEYRFFFIITPFTASTTTKGMYNYDKVMCGKYYQFFDDLPYGYPFDRPIFDDTFFFYDNMFFKDVMIFHKKDLSFNTNYVY